MSRDQTVVIKVKIDSTLVINEIAGPDWLVHERISVQLKSVVCPSLLSYRSLRLATILEIAIWHRLFRRKQNEDRIRY